MTHVFYEPTADLEARQTRLTGEEARHAHRVKRLAEGDQARVHDGKGGIAECRVVCARKVRGSWEIDLERVGPVRRVDRVKPIVHVVGAAPKGERIDVMIDGLSQCGAASWTALLCERTVVEPGEGKLQRLRRVAEESLKQSARAWLLEVGGAGEYRDVLREHRGALVIADASGEAWSDFPMEECTLLIGPEGGLSERELHEGRSAGARVCRFGPHTMRVETAAVAACAIIMRNARA